MIHNPFEWKAPLERGRRILQYARRLALRPIDSDYKVSYSQCGEDLIVYFALATMGIRKPVYVDVGANSPRSLNNTYLFYRSGCRGTCVEPNPVMFHRLRTVRKKDVCLNVAVVGTPDLEAELYLMTDPSLSTTSRAVAERYAGYGTHSIEQAVPVPVMSLSQIISKTGRPHPDYISIDTEGTETEILQSFDFAVYRPAVFCVETLLYTEDRSERKIHELSEFMQLNGYFAYADTYINTIYVDKSAWSRR